MKQEVNSSLEQKVIRILKKENVKLNPLEIMRKLNPKFSSTDLSDLMDVLYKLEKEGISLENWKKYLPETIEVKKAKGKDGFIFKPACGRVGEKISIQEACSKDEYKEILKDVKRHPKEYLAQKKFISKPVTDEEGNEYHVCLGSYTVNGNHSGYYARVSNLPRIDSNAADIPVLIERSQK